jgi:uncharacterized protein (TIGR03435 family)
MRRASVLVRLIGLFIFAPNATRAQAPATAAPAPQKLEFEVVSVRIATNRPDDPAAQQLRGGPGSTDPERLSVTYGSLTALLMRAYGVQGFQLSWPDADRAPPVALNAKLPSGTTEPQLDAMLRNMLAERFNLVVHHETKEMSVYELTQAAAGAKLQDASVTNFQPQGIAPGEKPPAVGTDRAGFIQLPPAFRGVMGREADGIRYWTGRGITIADLCGFLARDLERPVVDKTGLTGRYDFNLSYSSFGLNSGSPRAAPPTDPSRGGPTLTRAVQDQLGLKLESKKDGVDVLVVDHIDKAPTEN